MLRALIVGNKWERLAIKEGVKLKNRDIEVVAEAETVAEAYDKAFLENVDAVVSEYELLDGDAPTLLRKIRATTDEIRVIILISREKFIEVGTEIKATEAEYILKPLQNDEFEHIAALLAKYNNAKETNEYLSFILTERKFEDEALRNLIRNNTDYFEGVFRRIQEAERNTVLVKFACLKLINIAYEYFERLGFKRIKSQKNNASKKILALKNISEIIEYTKLQYMNIMQFEGKKSAGLYASVTERIKEYIEENYRSSELCLSKIAALFHFSPNYINDIFKTNSGISIPKYILEVRMNQARELLTTTQMSVKDVALSVGYDKTNYFPRIFKNKFSYSPMEYRSKFGKKENLPQNK